MVLRSKNGQNNSQIHGVMLKYGNNNLQSMYHFKLHFGVKVTVLIKMTLEDSTKTEKWPVMHLVKMTKEFMLLTMTMETKLV